MDISFQTNYWLGFPESNSDIILNLTHWQYWWWFWFTYYLTLYYFIFLKLIRSRLLKFSPKIVTSYRAHGKWGDFIICVVPISWCVNILSNSNFILRMIEWQTESNLFTVRVRGKQWYWVYKIEIKTLLNTLTAPKNYGHNYWTLYTNTNLFYNEDYLNILQIKINTSWMEENMREHWNQFNTLSFNHSLNTLNNVIWYDPKVWGDDFISLDNGYLHVFNYSNNLNSISTTHSMFFISELNRHFRFNYFNKFNFLNFNILDSKFLLKLNTSNSFGTDKNTPDNVYLVIKQKRFTPVKELALYKNPTTLQTVSPVFKNLNINLISQNRNIIKFLHKTNKVKPINFNNVYYRRLLRTRRILVLPTNINITVLTNSFDVVHSWYIPGLGVKLDCIPGRSTHHTVNIDHAGFYYGQCAEICGRYHHHMPIRVCALPFEHFLIWWYHYGIPYFTATKLQRKNTVISNIRQYNW